MFSESALSTIRAEENEEGKREKEPSPSYSLLAHLESIYHLSLSLDANDDLLLSTFHKAPKTFFVKRTQGESDVSTFFLS
jgi:hypothetical protein